MTTQPTRPAHRIEALGGAVLLLAAALAINATSARKTPDSAPRAPVFVHTWDSDDWVRRTFHVQKRYARVLVVDASGNPPKTIAAPELDFNRPSARRRSHEYAVAAVYQTLQEAADAADGGDLVAVMPGTYDGFRLEEKAGAAGNAYIHFKALGRPGEVVLNAPSARDPAWIIHLASAHHVIVEGFNLAGKFGPGIDWRTDGPKGGIMLGGDIQRSGRTTHHIAFIGNFSHNQRIWGMHSTDSHTVLVQDNLFALSSKEHSAYFSDGSDNYVIRRNVFYGSSASGLQCNLDPDTSLRRLRNLEAFRGYRADDRTREWALGLLRLADERFGSENYPDGSGRNFIIEENVINGNGRAGGGSLNLAGLQDSLIQNNLMYGNYNHGIAEWNDGNRYDAAYVDPGPQTAAAVKGPQDLPLFGCHGNTIRNNTVLMNNRGRAALLLRNGSWGNRVRNNVLVNDAGHSIEIWNTSVYRTDSGYNVANAIAYPRTGDDLKTLAVALDETNHSVAGVTRDALAPEFVRYGEEPWVIIEGNWWRLSPSRPDFRPRRRSPRMANRGDRRDLPGADLDGRKRKRADIGAYAAAQ